MWTNLGETWENVGIFLQGPEWHFRCHYQLSVRRTGGDDRSYSSLLIFYVCMRVRSVYDLL